jgi:hypothetical protein
MMPRKLNVKFITAKAAYSGGGDGGDGGGGCMTKI